MNDLCPALGAPSSWIVWMGGSAAREVWRKNKGSRSSLGPAGRDVRRPPCLGEQLLIVVVEIPPPQGTIPLPLIFLVYIVVSVHHYLCKVLWPTSLFIIIVNNLNYRGWIIISIVYIHLLPQTCYDNVDKRIQNFAIPLIKSIFFFFEPHRSIWHCQERGGEQMLERHASAV